MNGRSRPLSVKELGEKSEAIETFKKNSNIVARMWIRSAKLMVEDGFRDHTAGNLDEAYIKLLKSISILLEVVPHAKEFDPNDSEYIKLKHQSIDILDALDILKQNIISRTLAWDQKVCIGPIAELSERLGKVNARLLPEGPKTAESMYNGNILEPRVSTSLSINRKSSLRQVYPVTANKFNSPFVNFGSPANSNAPTPQVKIPVVSDLQRKDSTSLADLKQDFARKFPSMPTISDQTLNEPEIEKIHRPLPVSYPLMGRTSQEFQAKYPEISLSSIESPQIPQKPMIYSSIKNCLPRNDLQDTQTSEKSTRKFAGSIASNRNQDIIPRNNPNQMYIPSMQHQQYIPSNGYAKNILPAPQSASSSYHLPHLISSIPMPSMTASPSRYPSESEVRGNHTSIQTSSRQNIPRIPPVRNLPPLSSIPSQINIPQRSIPLLSYQPKMSSSIGMVGLRNLGNTCFMNSTLQCLSATVPLSRYFLDGSYRHHITRDNPLGSKGKVAEAYSQLIKSMWSSQDGVVIPSHFKDVCGSLQESFAGNEQQDSQEFLAFILDALHEDMNLARRTPIKNIKDVEQDSEGIPDAELLSQEWKKYKMRNWSIIVDMFQGSLKSFLECLTCGKTSTTFNTFMYLTLPVPQSRNPVSLGQCLDKFIERETLKGNDAWYFLPLNFRFCPRCKKKREATKTLTISKLPLVLLIHLKRFSYQGPFRDKVETFVDFPIKGLDLTSYIPRNGYNETFNYDLYGISNHYGGLNGGHYTAQVKNNYRQQWYHFDDSRISNSYEQEIKSSAAYILYYVRNGQEGAGSMMNWWNGDAEPSNKL